MKPIHNRLCSLSMVGLLTLFLGLVVACQGRFFNYRGAVVRQENRIELREGGPHKGSWKTGDLSVHYQYLKDQGKVELFGTVELAKRLSKSFTTLEYLILRVHLLDSEGKVLVSKGIAASEYRHMVRKLSFNRSLELPPGTAAIAFSYTGRVRDGGGTGRALEDAGNGDSMDFWIYPFIKGPESRS
jgi:hypothetical protein